MMAGEFWPILVLYRSVCEDAIAMGMFWLFLTLLIVLVLGNALTLLRTAKKPKIPEGVKPKPYKDDDEAGW